MSVIYSLKIKSPADLEELRDSFVRRASGYRHTIYICSGAGCISSHSDDVVQALKRAMALRGLTQEIRLVPTGCIGLCAQGPCMIVDPDGVFYGQLTAEKVRLIVDRHLIGGRVMKEFCYYDEGRRDYVPYIKDLPFFSKQIKIALRNVGRIDFGSVEDYIGHGGYFALAKVLNEWGREKTIEEVTASGLRGRGGAGFPTGVKWRSGHDQPDGQKYIICNADEGDPGAFMDRSILEGDPHSIIEALLIGGYCIGADKGFVYVRAEYPLAVERLTEAIEQARGTGLLGRNILGSDFSFDLEIRIGAGAFVCGEETALINSIEGKRGEPRQKPPFPFRRGLWGRSTIINNVETLANIPAVINNGAEWFSSFGVGLSKGTKVFALAGDIVNSGIIEIPMGISMREIIFEIGGGIKDGKKFKSVLSGGPSGGCLTERHLDVSVDYESLSDAGAIIGSGGLIVMDEDTCLVDTARYFMEFIQDESCGHCVPCRIGTKRMLETLQRITGGEATEEDIDDLETLAGTVSETAMCALGQTAPNPVLTTIKYFRDEYITHVRDKECPAHVCTALKEYSIDPDKCKGCGLCAKACPVDAISGEKAQPHRIEPDICIKCGSCKAVCRFDAVCLT